MLRILPYKPYSASARALSRGLGIKRLTSTDPGVRLRQALWRSGTVLNWGSTRTVYQPHNWINNPVQVYTATDKTLFLAKAHTLEGVQVPEYTTDKDEAEGLEWDTTVVRHLTRASGGRGIELVPSGEELPEAPLYVRYYKKKKEFRIHVAFGEVIDVTRKIRDPERVPPNWYVRNHANGFIFARESGQPTQESLDMAVKCVTGFNLHFGAVDLIEHPSYGSMVLEINTAPGLEGLTLEKYLEVFRKELLDE